MNDLIPETAPFNEEQRAWLNGFFSGLVGLTEAQASQAIGAAGIGIAEAVETEEEDFPWHDSALPIVDRMEMADGKPLERQLMAAMAQLDCGSCGYDCQKYSEAIAAGEESNLTLCSPGGKETKQMLKKLVSETAVDKPTTGTSNGTAAAGWSRRNPYTAKLVESRKLNGEGSSKDTRHVVIDLAGSGITYQVGDALGVVPQNCPELAHQIVDSMAVDANLSVEVPGGARKPLIDALQQDFCLKDPTDELLELLIDRIPQSDSRMAIQTLLSDGVPEGTDVLDILSLADEVMVTAAEFLEVLSPLNPRLYSIASSMQAVGDSVHLTVGKVAYEREGRLRKGVASTMLSDRLVAGEDLRVFVQPCHGGFTVPANLDTPMIMVGPGTGIAPFVAFLQQRAATGAAGQNWLFFGDQHESTDFLYREELVQYQSDGLLTRLDTAFSRDSDVKVYVQDRMIKNGAELWNWLDRGGHFYVCGDASRMAKDVDKALTEIIATHGNMSDVNAKQYAKQMAADKRYVRDVY